MVGTQIRGRQRCTAGPNGEPRKPSRNLFDPSGVESEDVVIENTVTLGRGSQMGENSISRTKFTKATIVVLVLVVLLLLRLVYFNHNTSLASQSHTPSLETAEIRGKNHHVTTRNDNSSRQRTKSISYFRSLSHPLSSRWKRFMYHQTFDK